MRHDLLIDIHGVERSEKKAVRDKGDSIRKLG